MTLIISGGSITITDGLKFFAGLLVFDFMFITEVVTFTNDMGLITEAVTTTVDVGSIT